MIPAMMLAPQPRLCATRRPLSNGMRGVRQTVQVMREAVRQGRVDPAIRQAASTLIFLTPERSELDELNALFSFVRDRVRYVRDVHEVETISTAAKTLAGMIGDCDDQTILLAALCESVGYPTRFIVSGYGDPGTLEHVYLQVFATDEWIDCDPTEPHPLGWSASDPVTIFTEVV